MHRDFCPRCAIKHLAQARCLLLEVKQGYPHHVWYALGHMAEAADEIVEMMPAEALAIRGARLELEQRALRAGERGYMPGLQELMYVVAKGALLEEVQEDPEVSIDPDSFSKN